MNKLYFHVDIITVYCETFLSCVVYGFLNEVQIVDIYNLLEPVD